MKISTLNDIPAVAGYLKRIGAEPRSLRKAVVREQVGSYWRDLAIIKLTKEGKIDCAEPDYQPTEAEQKAIGVECARVEWPQVKPLSRLIDLPPEVSSALAENVFEFRDLNGQVLMLQVRVEHDGGKEYNPYTYWSDDQWRKSEPEGLLPLWGLDQLKHHTTVFIHEGAKAARAMRLMVEAETPEMKAKLATHPWGKELGGAAHLGWIGGALSPHRTDWSVLRKAGVQRVYIVADNDEVGRSAVPKIAYHLHCVTAMVQFTNDCWPASFDLADEFPLELFESHNGIRRYVGPAFEKCLHPATWLTDSTPKNKGGKATISLRPSAQGIFLYAHKNDMLVSEVFPRFSMRPDTFDRVMRPFSHPTSLNRLVLGHQPTRIEQLCYRPDLDERVITDGNSSAFNVFHPSPIRSVEGDPQPFLDFMCYLVRDEKERLELLRWVATLIARPEIKIEYAILLISETQGTGKTTLGERILAPLVGMDNVSFPTEREIVDPQFNGWKANKRLAVIGEIYAGKSWKAYNNLKDDITAKHVDVNEKYERKYRVESWIHFFASSNSMKALKMDSGSERRFFVPEVTETPWPKAQFREFYDWLHCDGLGIIKKWAEDYGDYLPTAAKPPATKRKKQIQRQSLTQIEQDFLEECEDLLGHDEPFAVSPKELLLDDRKGEESYVDVHSLGRIAKGAGLVKFDDRIRLATDQAKVSLYLNTKAAHATAKFGEDQAAERNTKLRKWVEDWREWRGERGLM